MFIDSECWGEKPEAVEVTLTCVFVRERFERIEQEDEGEPTGVTGWRYREARMSHGEYAAYAASQMQEQASMLEDAIVELAEVIGGE